MRDGKGRKQNPEPKYIFCSYNIITMLYLFLAIGTHEKPPTPIKLLKYLVLEDNLGWKVIMVVFALPP